MKRIITPTERRDRNSCLGWLIANGVGFTMNIVGFLASEHGSASLLLIGGTSAGLSLYVWISKWVLE
jgi:hypothetical protein